MKGIMCTRARTTRCFREAHVCRAVKRPSETPSSPPERRSPLSDTTHKINKRIFGGTKFVSLHRAEEDIKEYCHKVQGEERACCFATLERLEQQHNEAVAAAQNRDSKSEALENLERLDSLARELSSIGNTRIMVEAMHHLQLKQAQTSLHKPASSLLERMEESCRGEDVRKQRLRLLFDQMDANADGHINVAEFRAAMDNLGDHLDGHTVSAICDALGIHGLIAFDQFRDIVEAEAIRSTSQEAVMLRSLLHNKSDEHFMNWLSSWD